jgi:hypothetical protein
VNSNLRSDEEPARPSPARGARGEAAWAAFAELVALVLLVSAVAWLSAGRLIGIPAERGASLVYVTSTVRLLASLPLACVAVAVALLGREARAALWCGLAHALRRRSEHPHGASSEGERLLLARRTVALRHELRPLWWLVVLLAPYARLGLQPAPLAGPLGHFTYDLAPWVVGAALGAVAVRRLGIPGPTAIGEWMDRRAAERPPGAPRIRLTYVVFALALAGAAVGSPATRFRGLVSGDEPKYLRFCEALLQTQGFDVGRLAPYREFSVRDVDWLAFPRSLAATVAEEVPSMLHDAGLIVRGEAKAGFNRASHHEGWFVNGKNGGVYQIHLPGLSFLLLAPYTIDRLRSGWDGYTAGFPTSLAATSVTLAILFALWITALYRFLRDATRMPRLAAAVAIVTGLTIPVAPFHALFYPEAVAGLVLLVLVRHLELGPPARLGRALWMGFLAGFLPWLHNRFALPSLFLAAWFVARHPRDLGALAGFFSPYAVVLALQGLYYYRITGSVLPTSMWAVVPGRAPLELAGLPRALAGYLFDRTYGIVPLAPLYLLAPAGIALAWRANGPRVARLMGLAAIVMVQAAGHFDWWGGGPSSPARLIVAAVPFAAMGFAELARAARGHRALAAVCAALVVLSVHNGVVYTRGYTHLENEIHTPTPFAYRTPLSFPYLAFPPGGLGATRWSLVGYWLAVMAGANAWVLIAARRGRDAERGTAGTSMWRERLAGAAPVVVVAGAALVYTGSATCGGALGAGELLASPDQIRSGLLDAICRHPHGWIVRAGLERFDPAVLKKNWLTTTYGFDDGPKIEVLKGGVVTDRVPTAEGRGRTAPRPALQVPERVPPRTRIARIELGTAVGGAHTLTLHARLGASETPLADTTPVLVIGVADGDANVELARQVVTAGELSSERYRAIALAVNLPHRADPVVGITKLGGGELWIEKAVLRHE